MGDNRINASNMKYLLDVSNRLSRCEGHLRSIRGMVQDGKSCEALFVQLAAVRSALHEASMKIYENHLEYCLKKNHHSHTTADKNRELKFISRLMLKGQV